MNHFYFYFAQIVIYMEFFMNVFFKYQSLNYLISRKNLEIKIEIMLAVLCWFECWKES